MTKSVGTKVRHAQFVTGLCPLVFSFFSDPIFGLLKQHCFGTPTMTKKLTAIEPTLHYLVTNK